MMAVFFYILRQIKTWHLYMFCTDTSVSITGSSHLQTCFCYSSLYIFRCQPECISRQFSWDSWHLLSLSWNETSLGQKIILSCLYSFQLHLPIVSIISLLNGWCLCCILPEASKLLLAFFNIARNVHYISGAMDAPPPPITVIASWQLLNMS